MPIDIPAFAYAATVAGGGIFGYVKSSESEFIMRRVFINNLSVFDTLQEYE